MVTKSWHFVLISGRIIDPISARMIGLFDGGQNPERVGTLIVRSGIPVWLFVIAAAPSAFPRRISIHSVAICYRVRAGLAARAVFAIGIHRMCLVKQYSLENSTVITYKPVAPPPALVISAGSPVELLLTDPMDDKSGIREFKIIWYPLVRVFA